MRTKILTATVAAATALSLSVAPATTAAANAQTRVTTGTDAAINQGIKNAFDPDIASSVDPSKGKAEGLLEMAFRPYSLLSSDSPELSAQGATQIIINYAIIATGAAIVGQIFQLIMKNLPR